MVRTICSVAMCCVLAQANAIARNDSDFSNLVQKGQAAYGSGQYAEAETAFAAALRLLGRNDNRDRAETLEGLGNVYVREDELAKAEKVYGQSLTIYKQLPDRRQTGVMLRHLAAVYTLEGRNEDGLRVLQQALRIARTDHDTRLEVEVLNVMGFVYYRQRKNSKAANYFNEALETAFKTQTPVNLGELLNNLGNVYQAEHKYEEAETLLKRALKYVEGEYGISHPDLTFPLSSLGNLYTSTGRYSDAEDQYRRALTILEQRPLDFDTRIAHLLHGLSLSYAKAGRRQEAYSTLALAAGIARRNVNNHTDMVKIMEDYSASLKKQGKPKEAEEVRAEANRARVAAGLVVTAIQPF